MSEWVHRNGILCEVATGQVHEHSVRNTRLQISERAGLTNVEVQYQVEIPRSYFTTESQMDPSLSYRLTFTQYYSQLTAGGHTFVAVSRYRGVWQRLDSQVAASDGFLRAGVGGPTLGGGMLYNTEDGSHFVPSSYSIRTLTPSWAGIFVNTFFGWQCGQINVTLYRRSEPSHKWEFYFNLCKGRTPLDWWDT
jgi:hypothetical protein